METQTKTAYTLRTVRLSDTSECWQVRAVLDTGAIVASVKMRTLTECSCVGVVFHLETRVEYRRQGMAYAMLAELEGTARRENVSLLVLTVRMDNLPCRALIRKAGFYEVCAWNNGRTGNNLVLGRKVLRLASE